MNRPRHPRPKSEKLIGWLLIVLVVFGGTWLGAMLMLALVSAWRAVFL